MKQKNTYRETTKEQARTAKPKSTTFGKAVHGMLEGSFLSKIGKIEHFMIFIYVTFLAFLLVANSNYSEKTVRRINKLKKEIEETRYEYISNRSELMHISKQSEVAKRLKSSQIKESVQPPIKLYSTNTDE